MGLEVCVGVHQDGLGRWAVGAGHPAFFSPLSPLALATLASGDSFVRLFAAERPEGISCLCPRPLTPVPCGPLPSSVSLFCPSRCVHNPTHVDHIKEKEARKQNAGDPQCCCRGPVQQPLQCSSRSSSPAHGDRELKTGVGHIPVTPASQRHQSRQPEDRNGACPL